MRINPYHNHSTGGIQYLDPQQEMKIEKSQGHKDTKENHSKDNVMSGQLFHRKC